MGDGARPSGQANLAGQVVQTAEQGTLPPCKRLTRYLQSLGNMPGHQNLAELRAAKGGI